MSDAKKTLLFLCTGNYYRSRFAEELFNAMASAQAPDWRADSRALAIEMGTANRGPISLYALAGLAERNIFPSEPYRNPLQCTEADLGRADYNVALQESEHRPLMKRDFLPWQIAWNTGMLRILVRNSRSRPSAKLL